MRQSFPTVFVLSEADHWHQAVKHAQNFVPQSFGCIFLDGTSFKFIVSVPIEDASFKCVFFAV